MAAKSLASNMAHTLIVSGAKSVGSHYSAATADKSTVCDQALKTIVVVSDTSDTVFDGTAAN
jgi:hypothetical protein